ncbi:hypothetical protein, partial [Klebsiella pneumoniae]|uniref:hypothetical protein n=1 Tax=Klebsiella pneumoniae TaxID=573 RepID=UPI001D0D8C72
MTEKRAGVNRKICVKSEEKAANMKKIHLPITWPRSGSGSVGNIRWLASQPETSQSPECHPAEKAIAA